MRHNRISPFVSQINSKFPCFFALYFRVGFSVINKNVTVTGDLISSIGPLAEQTGPIYCSMAFSIFIVKNIFSTNPEIYGKLHCVKICGFFMFFFAGLPIWLFFLGFD